ncbi:MAG: HAD family phosphatase, partial [Lachnospiraceae bacterium]|nr:HAD family phosphatase [Lachnospiraceae bacterium]
MIKNIVFDVGNVLTDFRWKGFLEDKGHDEAMIKRIEKATVDSPYWHEFDRGQMSDEECMQGFISEDPEIEDVLRSTFENIHGMV